jgi:hypothetical protein
VGLAPEGGGGAGNQGGSGRRARRLTPLGDITGWLADLPVWECALLMIGVPTTLVMLLILVVRRLVGLEMLGSNNEVAGFKYAVLGVIYAVLLGFAVIVVWENFSAGESAVMAEASALANIFRLAGGIDATDARAIRAGVDTYATAVVTHESQGMTMAGAAAAATPALTNLYTVILEAKPVTVAQSDVYQSLLDALTTLAAARRDRLDRTGSTVPEVIWFVLFGGAMVNVAFVLFFGARIVWAQVIMSGMLTAMIFMALFAIVMIDHPFGGTVRVSMVPLYYVLAHFRQSP